MKELFKKSIWNYEEREHAAIMLEDALDSLEDLFSVLGEYKETKDAYEDLLAIVNDLKDYQKSLEDMKEEEREYKENAAYYQRTHRLGYAPFNPFN